MRSIIKQTTATTRERFQILRHVASVVSSSGAKSDLPLPFPLPLAVSMARAIEHARKGHSGSAVRVVREALESIKRREKTDTPQYTFTRFVIMHVRMYASNGR